MRTLGDVRAEGIVAEQTGTCSRERGCGIAEQEVDPVLDSQPFGSEAGRHHGNPVGERLEDLEPGPAPVADRVRRPGRPSPARPRSRGRDRRGTPGAGRRALRGRDGACRPDGRARRARWPAARGRPPRPATWRRRHWPGRSSRPWKRTTGAGFTAIRPTGRSTSGIAVRDDRRPRDAVGAGALGVELAADDDRRGLPADPPVEAPPPAHLLFGDGNRRDLSQPLFGRGTGRSWHRQTGRDLLVLEIVEIDDDGLAGLAGEHPRAGPEDPDQVVVRPAVGGKCPLHLVAIPPGQADRHRRSHQRGRETERARSPIVVAQSNCRRETEVRRRRDRNPSGTSRPPTPVRSVRSGAGRAAPSPTEAESPCRPATASHLRSPASSSTSPAVGGGPSSPALR